MLGEVIPKVYANQKTLTFAKRMSGPLSLLSTIFKPLSQLLVSSTSIIEKRFNTKGYQISVDDLSSALDLAGENDTKEEEKRILRSIVEFGNIQVKEIMKSRVDVSALEQNTPFEVVKKLVIRKCQIFINASRCEIWLCQHVSKIIVRNIIKFIRT